MEGDKWIVDFVRDVIIFNQHYLYVWEENKKKFAIQDFLGNKNSVFLWEVTEDEISWVISGMKNKFSTSRDEISLFVLKTCSAPLLKPQQQLLNSCFQEGIFPDNLKITIVWSIFEKGNENLVENCQYWYPFYRVFFSKLIEKIRLDRLLLFFITNYIISGFQHGFIPKKINYCSLQFYKL